MNQITPDQLEALMAYASQRLGTTPEQLAKTVNQGGLSALTSGMSPENAAKVNALAGNKEKAEQLLQSAEAQQLIQRILGSK